MRRLSCRILAFFLLGLAWAGPAYAQAPSPPAPWTWHQVRERFLANNPKLAAWTCQSTSDTQTAWAAYLPARGY